MRMHSTTCRSLIDDFVREHPHETLVLKLHVRPEIFKRVRNYMYSGSLAAPVQWRKHKGRSNGHGTVERLASWEAKPVDAFEEQHALSEIWGFAHSYGMHKLEGKVLEMLVKPVFRKPAHGCSQACCAKFVV